MELGFLPKLRFAQAAHLCAVLEPGEEAKAILSPGMSASDFLGALVEGGLVVDAIRYMAVALPRREAVWWACACRRALLPPELPEGDLAAWKAAEDWVYDPTEPFRRACYGPAQALKFETAGAYAALGAYWSGGSLAPPEVSLIVPPGDGLTGTATAASVILTCVPGAAKSIGERQKKALTIGIDIANGGTGLADQKAASA
ncbi:hypothetical protein GCM10007301_16880 [Azorhizobium oxalatiphilum]|uniref:Uncharacterized protein n=1 Tax=Azorhizobium oxalatiphilum TaxID=980631 RepID=A0A917F967_9HYPH|nr:hypothetical protein [Azorhizobium oxalatiphilum]GGF57780.1 hypothetical protein GCM10007301_16880 [Azorhizobium oxalatiphilum]